MAQAGQAKPRIIDTGVPNLDLVLGGGLQQHNSYIFAGGSGTGKSVLVQQVAFHRASLGERVLFVTGLDEPHHNLLEHFSTFRFADFKLVGPQIETVSMVPFLDRPVPEKINVLRKTVLNSRPKMVIIDGLRSFAAYTGGMEGLFEFLYGLTSWFAVEGITLLLTKTVDPDEPQDNPEFGLTDGVIALQRKLVDGHTVRCLWVRKMRGQKALEGLHPFAIDANGIMLWPRLQATFQLEDRPVSPERAPFGLPALDAMLGGGLPEATTTLVAGETGAGKTMLALAFLAGGAGRNEPGLWLGFRETRSQLLAMAAPLGGDLGGQAQFITMAPMELDPDRLGWLVQHKVAEMGIKRLVLDGAELLANAFPNGRERSEFLTWLAQYLPQQGVTGLITQLAPRPAGAAGLADAALAPMAQNVIVLRQVHEQARLRRAIAVLKMAGPGYDATIRELTVDGHGLT
ncbi:MAG TPA: ATPase domain-containing protein, partial [Anaerolineae bacterium]|nr:ATPase domain-containing protein [Anaerolineae bacterium]